ncbi:CvpA family protein [Pontibacillus litoralis]|uniref:Membrane protein n=1 Tax=Pontibacillus litoralis JSM 072002 TaxID=1385512 RepID=A0A0A5HZP1_9BACI|nr:CvpA family protein [Pontibacillus litoralis]KGX89057.1 membrane protein [Pontibacillus litoralis JSM 072002]
MIDLLLLALFILGFFIGLKRGFILQLLHMVGFIVAFLCAAIYYDVLAPKLELWIPYPELPEGEQWAIFLNNESIEGAFYNAIAFVLIFFGAKIVLQIIASMLDFLADLPLFNVISNIFGAALGVIEVYFIVFILLCLIALIPIPVLQNALDGSIIAQMIIEHTPVLSNQLKMLWFEHVAEHL